MTRTFALRLCAVATIITSLLAPVQSAGQTRETRGFGAPQSVEKLSFTGSLIAGEQGGHGNVMAVGSLAMPLSRGASVQIDLGAGSYRDGYFDYAAAGRVFWRYGGRGALGFYMDYANVDPEHAGRIGVEAAYYLDRVSIEALVGVRTGTNVFDAAFDEIDVSYYVTDHFKGSVGHRLTSRGHVGTIGFEYAPETLGGWTFFGEAEAGEDENQSAFAGLRYTFGEGRYASLITRDRAGPMRVRVPRGIVDVSRCGDLPEKRSATFGHREMSVLCASRDELDEEGARERKK